MNLSSKDILLVSVAATIIAAASFAIYKDYTRAGKGSGVEIGTVVFKKKRAERKFEGSSDWEYVQQNIPVYNYDSIRTSEGSSAVVHLKNGSKIDLDENTLVIVTLIEDQAVIDFAGGSVSASKGGESTGLKLRSGKTDIKVAAGSMSVSGKGEKDISVNVSSGSSDVSVGGKAMTVKENQTAVVKGGDADVKANPVALEYPSQSAFIPLDSNGSAQITFSWKSTASSATLQVSQNRSFKNNVVTGKGSSSYAASLQKGDYFWRVVSTANEESEIRKFSVLEDRPVLPISPKQNESISFIKDLPSVNFIWESSPLASSYDIEIAKDPFFSKKELIRSSSLASLAIDTLEEGTYYWRVRGVYPSGSSPDYKGQPVKFLIVRARGLEAPQLMFPPDDFQKTAHGIMQAGLSLNWRIVREAAEYSIEVSQDKAFEKVDKKLSSSENQMILKDIKEGTYFWRLKALSKDGSGSEYSEVRRFSVVKDVPLQIVSASESADGSYLFVWKDPNESGKYRIEISKDREFSEKIANEESMLQRATIRINDAGRYFWRVFALDNAGKEIVKSGTAEVSVTDKIDAPVAVSPVNNKEVDVVKSKKISFEWKNVKTATEYEVEIYKYGFSSDKKIYSGVSKKDSMELTDFSMLSNGKFYWQVRAVRKNATGVAARSVSTKAYFVIPSGPDLAAPKIGTIKVYVE
jgi:FecR protein